MKAFISYSHRDEEALERLHVHLAALCREQRIETWYDREILAGGMLEDEINRELETASLFLLLVSPDFIASDYCVEREMTRALERQEAGEARVVPIIVEPCDWQSVSALRRLKAIPKDGTPISDWANANNAYLDVIQELRRISDTEGGASAGPASNPKPEQANSPVSRYRVQRDFDEIDRSEFRDSAFSTMKEYFRKAASEIDAIDDIRARFVDRGPTSFSCTVINQARRSDGTAHITMHSSTGRFGLGDIYFSFGENAPENSMNGGYRVEADEYEMYLSVAMPMYGNEPDRLTPEQAAEHLWNRFIEQAGIDTV